MNLFQFENIHKIFIISSGRTGTEFFGDNFNKISNDIISVHEPDRLAFNRSPGKEILKKVKEQGVSRLILLKIFGFSGTRNLSLLNLNAKLPAEEIIERFVKDRRWIAIEDKNFYIEANYQLFGLIDKLTKLPDSKIIVIFRDPRDWVRSWMNQGGWYTRGDLLSMINLGGVKRITPQNAGIHNPYWHQYTRFQKLCWAWNFMNSQFYSEIKKKHSNLKYFFFEDLFTKKNYEKLSELLKFALNSHYDASCTDSLYNLLNIKVNESNARYLPSWQNWDSATCKILHHFCGDLMLKLGYGKEAKWLSMLK